MSPLAKYWCFKASARQGGQLSGPSGAYLGWDIESSIGDVDVAEDEDEERHDERLSHWFARDPSVWCCLVPIGVIVRKIQ